MYAAVRKYKTIPGAVSALIKSVQEGFVPIISQVPGFVAYYALDTGNDTVASISVFDDQAGADASTSKAADWVKQNLAHLVQGAPEITAGEVLIYQTT
jgi:hypothetical protein